ncbi:hypothetical protein [Isoalcanivorax indicus]|uniref:hypothetical protein n=1 Tax=Isoalcanivorax indicus TaxID=2202653 RepID=UPI0013C42041|nr:hypothetical protein [Isoalcanivorax indicus]
MTIDRPEIFFERIHPYKGGDGSVVLERLLNKKPQRMLVPPRELEILSRRIYNLKDVRFSTGCFSGLPLLLNMRSTSCCTVRIPKSQGNQTFHIVTMRLDRSGIPLCSVCVDDGRELTFIWTFESPIQKREFFDAHIIQNTIKEKIEEFSPTQDSADLSSLIPFVGSQNSKTGVHAAPRHIGKSYSKEFLREKILDLTPASKRDKHLRNAGLLLELQSLFDSRWWAISSSPEQCKNWVLFFGVALSPFCSPKQMELELKAISESIEQKPWRDIKEKYKGIIGSITSSCHDGFIKYNGSIYSVYAPHWPEWVKGALSISNDEISDLDLKLLSGEASLSPHLSNPTRRFLPVGNWEFVPESRFLLKKVS